MSETIANLEETMLPENTKKKNTCLCCGKVAISNDVNDTLYQIKCKHFGKEDYFNSSQIFSKCPICNSTLEILKDTNEQMLFFCSNKKCEAYNRKIHNGKVAKKLYKNSKILEKIESLYTTRKNSITDKEEEEPIFLHPSGHFFLLCEYVDVYEDRYGYSEQPRTVKEKVLKKLKKRFLLKNK